MSNITGMQSQAQATENSITASTPRSIPGSIADSADRTSASVAPPCNATATAANTTDGVASTGMIDPLPADVLLGRAAKVFHHSGNKR